MPEPGDNTIPVVFENRSGRLPWAFTKLYLLGLILPSFVYFLLSSGVIGRHRPWGWLDVTFASLWILGLGFGFYAALRPQLLKVGVYPEKIEVTEVFPFYTLAKHYPADQVSVLDVTEWSDGLGNHLFKFSIAASDGRRFDLSPTFDRQLVEKERLRFFAALGRDP